MEKFIQTTAFKKQTEILKEFDSALEECEKETFKEIDTKFDFCKYQEEVSKDHPVEDLTQMYNEIKTLIDSKEVAMQEVRKQLTEMALAFQNLKENLNKEFEDSLEMKECLNYVVERIVDATEGTVDDQTFIQKKKEIREMKQELPEGYLPKRIFKSTCKHIVEVSGTSFNLKYIQEWTGHKSHTIIFDSDKDGIQNETFNKCILNKQNIGIIYIDKKDNVFGYYSPLGITKIGEYNYDNNHFIFSLKREQFETGKQFFVKDNVKCGILLRDNDDILSWLGNSDFGFACYKPGKDESFFRKLSLVYNDIDDIYLNDTNYPIEFGVKRIVVMQFIN
ncbi:hypothetical protein EHI8A_216450 [Entamoeba histolytica HM-1:IMSS-B]|uniref:TLDc domain-containing protein n=5 Tax=Entamoeba histolytica TaxID=5759 RepID=A0A175JEW0_ENTHI|nr:Hypothetical protein EHI5A_251880 [Entamoeba histolytica KU27]EMH77026.1 hypothetical protein EHI8A_216450 [Entamoeba histolytica HM-1:IMSS-B]EMS14436.1 hypothetical protein KM1_291120 [Entamoeba histolytica HM-3:IMSS]ENY63889.1 hypothetical protein EHI7A_192970 [Entamoeba histolytica HM-1:IMSS-A]GAT92028.1 hypothetical protein conserved [Entamoeba histolytica]